jgi:hypothetical protein
MDAGELRRRVRERRSLSDALYAFVQLIEHSDVTWGDVLDGLECPGLIAETAVIQLYRTLDIPVDEAGFIMQRAWWERTLGERAMTPESLIRLTSPDHAQ